eukprot:scaffold151312_cov21-Tisochrysis_lutea.AAC.1
MAGRPAVLLQHAGNKISFDQGVVLKDRACHFNRVQSATKETELARTPEQIPLNEVLCNTNTHHIAGVSRASSDEVSLHYIVIAKRQMLLWATQEHRGNKCMLRHCCLQWVSDLGTRLATHVLWDSQKEAGDSV